jgi:catalase
MQKPKTCKTAMAAPTVLLGTGGELHQLAGGSHPQMTTSQGGVIADDENSLNLGGRGPVLLEDFALLEKINHFDHEGVAARFVTNSTLSDRSVPDCLSCLF